MLAKTTLHHGGDEKTGSTPTLRTIYMHTEDGQDLAIPYINGNAIRGKLRRMLMIDFFQRVEVDPQSLKVKTYHMFFAGGALESTEDTKAVIDMPLRKQMKTLFVPMALLGGAIGNQMLSGVLKVGHAFPVCQEYKIYLPERLKDDKRCDMAVRSFTDESFQTRRDELHAEREEDEQAVQMKIGYECFIPGTKFYHWFALEWANDVEQSCFGHMLNLFRQMPFVGGKSGTGNGEVIFQYEGDLSSSQMYLKYLSDHKLDIQALISTIEGAK